MDAIVAQIADNCFRLAMADGSWLAIGFGRRPRRGLIWGFTTPAWKVALEKRIHRELLLAFSAAHLTAFDSRGELLSQLVEFYWGDDGGRFGRTFQFLSKQSCENAIAQFFDSHNWETLFLDHLDVTAVPDKRLRAGLLVHCTEFAMNVRMIPLWIKSHGVDMARWPKPMIVE